MEKFPQKHPASAIERDTDRERMVVSETKEYFDKVVRWGGIGAIVGVSMFSVAKSLEINDDWKKYRAHIEKTLDKDAYEEISERLVSELGEDTIESLEAFDRIAFVRRESPISEPEFVGFENFGDVHIQNMPTYNFTEKFNVYPKNWINGQINHVVLKNNLDGMTEEGAVVLGRLKMDPDTYSTTTILYDVRDHVEVNPSEMYRYLNESYAHETGHANDWLSRIDLTLLERTQMLESVIERISSEDAYDGFGFANGISYWRYFDDGTAEGKNRSAREYWAVICAEYFTNPEVLERESPKDFDLVDSYVRRSDPNFDIFDPERGAFDPETGEIRDKWKAELENVSD